MAPVVANLTQGSGVTITNGAGSITISATGSGGTVTSVSVVSANGLAGTVATATTTPAITLSTTVGTSGVPLVLLGNGTAISGVSSVNSAVLITSAGGLASFATTLPATVQGNITTVGTITSGTWNGGIIPLAYGGSNANLTASNGGIVYSTASAMAILAGTATAKQILMSGASTTPTWSTATYPTTTTINQLLYSSVANIIAGLATANNGVLITSSGGVPSVASTLPSAVQGNITTVGTITSGTWNGGIIPIAYGGTNSSTTLNNNRIMVSSGGSIVESSALTNGQLLIGSTGAAPVVANLTQGTGITITNSAGGITITNSSPSSGGTVTTVSVVSANGLAGTVATATTTPAITLSTTVGTSGVPLVLLGNGTAISGVSSVNSAVLITSAGGLASFATTLPATVQGNITTVGTITSGTWNAGVIPIAYGGTNSSTALSGNTIMISNGSAIVQGSAGTTTTVLHGNASGSPSYSAVSLTTDVSGILPLANGGSNANLTASNGGIVYSTASAMAILAGTATAS